MDVMGGRFILPGAESSLTVCILRFCGLKIPSEYGPFAADYSPWRG
jgi:hypothetical protein